MEIIWGLFWATMTVGLPSGFAYLQNRKGQR